MTATCSAYPPDMLLQLPLNTAHFTTFQYLTIRFTFKRYLHRTAFENLFTFTCKKHVSKLHVMGNELALCTRKFAQAAVLPLRQSLWQNFRLEG